MQYPDNLVLVTDLLRDVLEALGRGHRALVRESRSDLGILAVKSAEVRVEFALSAVARTSEHGIGVGVRPTVPFGLSAAVASQEQTLQVGNRASVVLQVVNVLAAEERRPLPPGEAPDPLRLIAVVQQWIQTEKRLAALLLTALVEVRDLLAAGREADARRRAAAVLQELEALLAETGATPPPDVRAAMEDLAAWAGPVEGAEAQAHPWRAQLRGPIVALNTLVANLAVPEEVKREFGAATGQALLSRDVAEAGRHLVGAIEQFRARTRDLALPPEVRQALDRLDLGTPSAEGTTDRPDATPPPPGSPAPSRRRGPRSPR
ncbi:MAG TPA: hypothetical protein VMT79_00440 [Candidatus Binatia bacterium]|nr:hypothetical protein [Candidatus Binatia bacterium]